MSESQELKEAINFIKSGESKKARPLLLKLFASKNLGIKMYAGMNLTNILDRTTENKKLIYVTNETINVASKIGQNDIKICLLARKAEFLFQELSLLTYRLKNLKLAANVFRWIDFSLEKNKKEFEATIIKKENLEKEISSLETDILASISSITDSSMRGHIFMSLAEISFSRFLYYNLDLVIASPLRSKIMNIYFVKRWNLDKLIGFNKNARKKIRKSYKMSINYFEKSIREYEADSDEPNTAQAFYNLATKFTLTYHFSKANRYLIQAKRLAEKNNARFLFPQIYELEKRIKDKYKHVRNYVEERGLDLP